MRRVGLDLGVKAPHTAVLVEAGRLVSRPWSVAHDQEGFESMLARALDGHEGPIEFVLEPTGNIWQIPAAWLVDRGQQVLLATGQKVSDLRKVLRRHTKTDVMDGLAAARVPDLDPYGSSPWSPPDADRASLLRLARQRDYRVKTVTKSKLRINNLLELVQPYLASALGGQLLGPAGRTFLRELLDPFQVRALGKSGLEQFFASKPGRKITSNRLEKLWDACEKACEFYGELQQHKALPFSYEVVQEELNLDLDLMEHVEQQIEMLTAKMDALYSQIDPDRALEQLPGVGSLTAAILEALVGEVDRFRSASAFVSFCGLVPRKADSATRKKKGLPITKTGNKLLKTSLFLAAKVAYRRDLEFARAEQRYSEAGKHFNVRMVALANKLARRVYSLLRRRNAMQKAQYEFRDGEGKAITKQEARRRILEDFPSKRERAQRAAAEKTKSGASGPGCSGQSKDSASRDSRGSHSMAPHPTDLRTALNELLQSWEQVVHKQRTSRQEKSATSPRSRVDST